MVKKKSDDLDEELRKEASRDTARSKARGGGSIGGPANKISVKDKRFSLGDQLLDKETKGRSFKGVLLNFAFVNEYYPSAYNANKPTGPVCWALSEDGEEMAPHKNSAEKQNGECADCPWNAWGSKDGEKKGAKACKQGLRIALVHEDDIADAESAEAATIGFIPLPPTSVKPFNTYMEKLEELGRPMHSVLTEFSFDDDVNYAIVNYEMSEKLTDRELIDALKGRRDEALELIMTPYNKMDAKDDDDEDEKPRKKKRPADEDEDEDEKPTRKKKAAEEEDDDGEDEKPARKKKRAVEEDDEDEDEDEEDAEDEDDDDDDEEDTPTRRKGKSSGSKSRRAAKDDEENDEDDEEDEDEKPTRRKSKSKVKDEEEEEDEEDEDDGDEKPVKKRGSRFGKK